MRKYSLSAQEQALSGFSDLIVIPSTDLVTNTTTAHVLMALALGDVVQRVLQETKTYVAGPATATGSVGVVGALTTFTAASDLKTAAAKYVAAVASVTPYPTNTAVNMVFNAILGSGAVTAGEIWIWVKVNRAADRNISA